MKIILRIIGGIVVFSIVAFFVIGGHYEAGPPLISTDRATELLNGCESFTHVGQDTRKIASVTEISKGQNGTDAGSDLGFANIRWEWTSGNHPQGLRAGDGKARFRWIPISGLRDWNFPENQWTLEEVDQLGDESPVHCAHGSYLYCCCSASRGEETAIS